MYINECWQTTYNKSDNIKRYNVILTIYLLPRGGYKHSKKINTLRVELALTRDH